MVRKGKGESRDQGQHTSQSAKVRLPALPGDPLIFSRDEHNISRKLIDPDALKVMYRLINHGYQAFLVGGGVRDLLLGKKPKDYDVSTDARPEEVKKLFRNCHIIGRRFKLAHIVFAGRKVIEVSTFRSTVEMESTKAADKPLRSDNTYGDPETDARRRDLTINGLFYDLSSFSVIDYVDGVRDLEDGVIRIIGDPEQRFKEDPVRMIRAIRHAARTGFAIDPATYQAICDHPERIELCAKPRVYEEFLREMRHGASQASFRMLRETGILPYLCPFLAFVEERDARWQRLEHVLEQFDLCFKHSQELNPSALFATMAVAYLEAKSLIMHDQEVGGINVAEVWSSAPLKGFYEHDFAVPTKFPDIDFTKYYHYIKNGYLRYFINRLFHQLGVSNKECERIEQLLVLRMAMFEVYYGISKITGIETRQYLGECLQFMKILSFDHYTEHCYRYWHNRCKDKLAGRKPEAGKPPRKRRRGPRRL
ncbi:MAG: polynucleotide adenylyltransferase PcnB [Deltaproteobacteria bacterium]|nr:polynucleotide adenylyltransferase PcnB [Deltaproteobacteria bacterium]